MKQRKLWKVFILVIGFFILGIGTSFSSVDIKTRMKNRLPVIIELKEKGFIGENKLGYLEFIGDEKVKPAVVAEENKDRKTAYEAIAKQQGTTAELVGKRRALQIIKKAGPGEWVQNESGEWIQK